MFVPNEDDLSLLLQHVFFLVSLLYCSAMCCFAGDGMFWMTLLLLLSYVYIYRERERVFLNSRFTRFRFSLVRLPENDH